jgi:hypothetical protein
MTMTKLVTILVAKLLAKGIFAACEVIPGADGGIIVRVGRLAHVEPAEKVAAEVEKDYGVTVLVAF